MGLGTGEDQRVLLAAEPTDLIRRSAVGVAHTGDGADPARVTEVGPVQDDPVADVGDHGRPPRAKIYVACGSAPTGEPRPVPDFATVGLVARWPEPGISTRRDAPAALRWTSRPVSSARRMIGSPYGRRSGFPVLVALCKGQCDAKRKVPKPGGTGRVLAGEVPCGWWSGMERADCGGRWCGRPSMTGRWRGRSSRARTWTTAAPPSRR